MVAPFLGGHWSVVVPTVVSASPMRHCGRCYPRSRTVQAGDTIVPRKKNKLLPSQRLGLCFGYRERPPTTRFHFTPRARSSNKRLAYWQKEAITRRVKKHPSRARTPRPAISFVSLAARTPPRPSWGSTIIDPNNAKGRGSRTCSTAARFVLPGRLGFLSARRQALSFYSPNPFFSGLTGKLVR